MPSSHFQPARSKHLRRLFCSVEYTKSEDVEILRRTTNLPFAPQVEERDVCEHLQSIFAFSLLIAASVEERMSPSEIVRLSQRVLSPTTHLLDAIGYPDGLTKRASSRHYTSTPQTRLLNRAISKLFYQRGNENVTIMRLAAMAGAKIEQAGFRSLGDEQEFAILRDRRVLDLLLCLAPLSVALMKNVAGILEHSPNVDLVPLERPAKNNFSRESIGYFFPWRLMLMSRYSADRLKRLMPNGSPMAPQHDGSPN